MWEDNRTRLEKKEGWFSFFGTLLYIRSRFSSRFWVAEEMGLPGLGWGGAAPALTTEVYIYMCKKLVYIASQSKRGVQRFRQRRQLAQVGFVREAATKQQRSLLLGCRPLFFFCSLVGRYRRLPLSVFRLIMMIPCKQQQ
ncbi:uncharacterized protein Ecym_2655 [Eremothecium cymbalariae DBVPG|uniref:Uncharacterized protein n=1 Tax=Eremothecium cymbalariae (strain CBS 270.75 / DBVPG 7215 / KCTC 17166 / NRRL Y-17582) TaxID=931890 RepID=G8JNU1_ERECY|nr:Hypothetical protein Ecym_2655 [Eremothecium cymbalariae DBVPG\